MTTIDTRYPGADRESLVERLHGRPVADPYRWLEDAADPRTLGWQAAQDELWRRHAASLPGRYRFRHRVAALSSVGSVSTPRWRGSRQFVLRRAPGQDHPILYADDAVLIDPMSIDPSGLTTLDSWEPSADGRLLAYQLSRGGDEQSTLYVRDLTTGRLVDHPIERCRYSPVAWLPDGSGFYFVRSRQVWLHRIGKPDDVLVAAAEASYGLQLSADGRWLTISAARGAGNDLWLADLSQSGPERPDLVAAQQDVDARSAMTVGRDGRLYVATTLDAPAGRICRGDPADPEHWQELVAEDATAPLAELAVLDGPELARPLLLVSRIRNTLGEIVVHDLHSGERLGTVPLPGLGTVASLTTRRDGGHELWFAYTDSATPVTIQRYDARSGLTTSWAEPPGGGRTEVEARQVEYRSADGTPVRMLVLAKPGSSGPRPTILYGYGGFGKSLTPSYSAFTLAWVEAGGVFVTANLRGGGEYGADWHWAGILDRKQKVFDDFIAAAQTLIDDGWTTADQLGCCGESNGGLLVGAAITQRPDLFAAAVCSAPLLDMVRYEHSGLGRAWVDEYGSASDPAQLANLLAYSPYHRVVEGTDYPAVLFTVFGADTRVDPLHARKICAALQHATACSRPVLLRLDDDAGHSSAAVSRGVGLAADMLAFLAAHTGLSS